MNKDRPIYINVLQDGSYSVGGDVVNLNDLEFKLKVRFEEKPDQKLVLRGDSKAFHGQIASALDIARRVGFSKASIAYDTRPLELTMKIRFRGMFELIEWGFESLADRFGIQRRHIFFGFFVLSS